MFNTLSFSRCTSHVLLCRPAVGNLPFAVPIEQAHNIFLGAESVCSGLAKRTRLTMPHATGKIEILASTSDRMIFRYHRAASLEQSAKVVICRNNPEAYWFDDYQEFMEVVSLGDG